LDVDQWLSELPAGTLDRHFEAYKLDPWGDDWERTSLLTSTLANLIQALAPRPEGADPPEEIPLDAFMPYRKGKQAQDTLTSDADAMESRRM